MSDAEQIDALRRENEELRAALAAKDKFIRETMGAYVTTEVASEILDSKHGIGIGGERRVVTMMFTDLRDSTALSERMSPNDYLSLYNHYLADMIMIIDSWQGNILGFVGDAIVALFGAPRHNPTAARNAVFSAVAMQRRMHAINEWNASREYPQIKMGVGIHTGEAIVGTIGSQERMKYDMIGRNVNLASRVEGFTHGGQILVTSETLAAAGDEVVERAEAAFWARPKGIRDEVLLHDVVGMGSLRIPRWWEDKDA